MPVLPHRPLAPLAPRPPQPIVSQPPKVTFYDLPAELRIEIYKLALAVVQVHILPPDPEREHVPHPLTLTSRQVRNEVLPILHASCPIRCIITDFDFQGLLSWLSRVPPREEGNLAKNKNLTIRFNTTSVLQKQLHTLRTWLHMRADKHRPQPKWQYSGPQPTNKICADLRRRCKRMREAGKQREMVRILDALHVQRPLGLIGDREAASGTDTSTSQDQNANDTPDRNES